MTEVRTHEKRVRFKAALAASLLILSSMVIIACEGKGQSTLSPTSTPTAKPTPTATATPPPNPAHPYSDVFNQPQDTK